MITIHDEGDRTRLQFSYNARLVAAVKEVPGRRFDSDTKTWTIPTEHVAQFQANHPDWFPSHDEAVATGADQLDAAVAEATKQERLVIPRASFPKELAARLRLIAEEIEALPHE